MPSTSTNDGSAGPVADAETVSAAEHCFYALAEPATTTDRPVPDEQAFAKDLERVPEAAAEARRLVAHALQAWCLPQVREDAEAPVHDITTTNEVS